MFSCFLIRQVFFLCLPLQHPHSFPTSPEGKVSALISLHCLLSLSLPFYLERGYCLCFSPLSPQPQNFISVFFFKVGSTSNMGMELTTPKSRVIHSVVLCPHNRTLILNAFLAPLIYFQDKLPISVFIGKKFFKIACFN